MDASVAADHCCFQVRQLPVEQIETKGGDSATSVRIICQSDNVIRNHSQLLVHRPSAWRLQSLPAPTPNEPGLFLITAADL